MEDFVQERADGRRNNLKSVCCRHKNFILLLTVSVLIMAGLLIFCVYQMNWNRELVDTFTSKTAHSSAQFSDFPLASQSGDKRNVHFSIGMRQDYLLQECQGTSYKLSFPDIDYALMGYNVLRGYPLATGHDPGFTYPIFAADYHGTQTADCRYSVPQGLVVVPDVSCVTSFSSQIVQTQYEFAEALSVSGHVSGGGWGVKFSASAGYKQSTSTISSGEWVYIISSANCNYYFSKLVKRNPPMLDPNFLSWVHRLDKTSSKDVYIEFFETYGTHFATEVTFGARFTYEYKMASKKFQTQSEKGVNVAVEASYSGLFSVGGGFGMESSHREAASDFLKSVESKTITVGAAPPASGDAMTWASTVKQSPVPTKYKLSSIENLFTEKYMDQSKLGISLNVIFKNIKKYQYEYCKYLMTKGEVESCEELSPGMVLGKTRLNNHYDGKALSYKECIDYCLKHRQCLGMTYCEKCESRDVNHQTCYLYSYKGNGDPWNDGERSISAEEDSEWKSILFVGKMKQRLELAETQVIGAERGFDRQDYKRANASMCYDLCLADAHCVTYSHCECPDVEVKCKLFSFENVLGFKREKGTSSFFVPKFED